MSFNSESYSDVLTVKFYVYKKFLSQKIPKLICFGINIGFNLSPFF